MSPDDSPLDAPRAVREGPADLPVALSEEDSLVARIKWTTLARVVLFSLVLCFAIAVDLGLGPQRAAAQPEVLLYQMAALAYTLSFLLLLSTLFGSGDARWLGRIAWASVATDLGLALSLIFVTDGLQSLFQFGLPLAVLNAAVLLDRTGAMAAAGLASLGMALVGAGEVGLLTLPRLRVAYLSALGPAKIMNVFEIVADLALQIAAAFATALLSSHLLRELDRTRRRAHQSRRELATLRVRYEDVVSSLPDGLVTLDADGAITSANPAAEAILQVSAADLRSRGVEAVLPELAGVAGRGAGEWEISRTVATDLSSTQQVSRQTADGRQQTIACRVAPLRDQDGREGRLLVLRDMTETRARDEVHRNRERLAAIGSMAAAVAHEIRNPLASISGAVQLLQSSDAVAEADRPLMQIVVRETSQLSEWIDEFLSFAKPRRAVWAQVDLRELLQETAEACRIDPRVVAAGVAVDLAIDTPQSPEDPWRMRGDQALLRQVLWNLLRNACQAVLTADRRQVIARLSAEDGMLVLRIADSGPGFADQELSMIFEPFHTTKAEGTGLGLATVRRHVEAHRGQVAASHSAELGGALLEVRLPRQPPADAFGDTSRSGQWPKPKLPANSPTSADELPPT